MPTGLEDLVRYTHATSIVGDILKIRAHDVGLDDMALVEMTDGEQSLAQAIQLDGMKCRRRSFAAAKGFPRRRLCASPCPGWNRISSTRRRARIMARS